MAVADGVVVSGVAAVSVMQQEVVVGATQNGIASMTLVDRFSSRRHISEDKASGRYIVLVVWTCAPGIVVVVEVDLRSPPLLSFTSSVCFFDCNNDDDDDDGDDRRPMTIFVRYI